MIQNNHLNNLTAELCLTTADCTTNEEYNETNDVMTDSTKLMTWLNIVGDPVVVLIGMVGNVASLVVFLCTTLRRQSTNIYLAFLSIVDVIFLTTLAINWLAWLDIQLVNEPGWCQATIYMSYVSSFLSAWTVVSFTSERWVVVFFPLRRAVWCSRRRSICILALCTGVALLLYSFALWTSDVVEIEVPYGRRTICALLSQYNELMYVMTIIDSIATFVVPSSVITVLNACIGCKVWLAAGRKGYGIRMGERQTRHTTTASSLVSSVSAKIFRGCCCGSKTTLYSPERASPLDCLSHDKTSAGVCPETIELTVGNSAVTIRPTRSYCQIGRLNSGSFVRRVSSRQLQSACVSQKVSSLKALPCHPSVDGASIEWKRRAKSSQSVNITSLHRQQLGGSARKSQVKVTRMLLIISTAFLLLNLPSHAIRLYLFTAGEQGDNRWQTQMWQHVLQFLTYVNFSANFIFYAALSRSFRQAACQLRQRLVKRFSALCATVCGLCNCGNHV